MARPGKKKPNASKVWRALLLWLHIVAAVCWMGQALAVTVLLIISATSAAGDLKIGTILASDLLDQKILGYSAITAAWTGFGLSTTTTWGYFRSRWVTTKFVMTIAQILTGTSVAGAAYPQLEAASLDGKNGASILLAIIAVGLVAAGGAFQVFLSVSKPWGRTRWGHRAQTRGAEGRLAPAPTLVVAGLFLAALVDLAIGLVTGIPLPSVSTAMLVVALVVRRRARTRLIATDAAAGGGRSAADRGSVGSTRVLDGVVAARTQLTDSLVQLRVAVADGSPVSEWEPGAHIDLLLPSGKVRQYSLHGDPEDRGGFDVSVVREAEGRGGSIEIFDLAEGAKVGIGGPRNNFPLVNAPRYLFVAGGIGITALKPMLEAIDHAGQPWQLIYRGRTRVGMPFADELSTQYPDQVSISAADADARPNLDAALAGLPDGSVVYCCGPSSMMDSLDEKISNGYPNLTLHVERFAATARDDSQNRPFKVFLPQTGELVDVPADKSALDSLRSVLPELPGSCETGICGSCEMRVLAGRPEHRDDILTAAEGDRTDVMYPCVSRSKDPLLVLDA
ncbi:ferredoxin-NADP reductase [Frondihabitans australicus]|uniref:Ferredoxin-NADP reductase n=1 Tax=Frondihabitans australicus TaxID=386892 RepID=A0A495IH04_9MICO|nr:ferredoxin-NADP reductase [Frondihabitans australicus]